MLKGFHLQEKVFLTNISTTPLYEGKSYFHSFGFRFGNTVKKAPAFSLIETIKIMVGINL